MAYDANPVIRGTLGAELTARQRIRRVEAVVNPLSGSVGPGRRLPTQGSVRFLPRAFRALVPVTPGA